MKLQFFLLSSLFTLSAHAQKFDDYLLSIEKSLPIHTQKLRQIINSTRTRLAHPSHLQKWGIINSTAVASYNGILNTIIIDPELTIDVNPKNPKEGRRAKTWFEMQAEHPLTFSVPLTTLFHELSHAEFEGLKKSSNPIDNSIHQFLNTEFKNYMETHHPHFNFFERHVAVSELYAYYQGDFLFRLMEDIDDILIDNGYNKFKKSCWIYPHLLKSFENRPLEYRNLYVLNRPDFEYINTPLPTLYVFGKDLDVDSKNPIYSQLQKALWVHFSRNFKLPQSKSALVNWINTQPQYLKLIAPCRTSL